MSTESKSIFSLIQRADESADLVLRLLQGGLNVQAKEEVDECLGAIVAKMQKQYTPNQPLKEVANTMGLVEAKLEGHAWKEIFDLVVILRSQLKAFKNFAETYVANVLKDP